MNDTTYDHLLMIETSYDMAGCPFHWKAIHILHTLFSLVAKIRELYPEADGNYMGFKRRGVDEKMS